MRAPTRRWRARSAASASSGAPSPRAAAAPASARDGAGDAQERARRLDRLDAVVGGQQRRQQARRLGAGGALDDAPEAPARHHHVQVVEDRRVPAADQLDARALAQRHAARRSWRRRAAPRSKPRHGRLELRARTRRRARRAWRTTPSRRASVTPMRGARRSRSPGRQHLVLDEVDRALEAHHLLHVVLVAPERRQHQERAVPVVDVVVDAAVDEAEQVAQHRLVGGDAWRAARRARAASACRRWRSSRRRTRT